MSNYFYSLTVFHHLCEGTHQKIVILGPMVAIYCYEIW